MKALAAKLTAPYPAEEDKVRSVFVWITAHITYDTKERMLPPRRFGLMPGPCIGCRGIKGSYGCLRRLCALVKVLCEEAGIRSVIIEGNGRSYRTPGEPWISNHAWNAVYVAGGKGRPGEKAPAFLP